jgi:hypothetical protein
VGGALAEKQHKYRNVSTLGWPGKHPLPLEDRKELLLCMVVMLTTDLVLSKIAVSQWSAVTTMAAFYLLSRAGPKMSLRTLWNDNREFVIRDAAVILATAATSLGGTEKELTALIQRLVSNCWSRQSVIVDEAIDLGFDPEEAEEKSSGLGGKRQRGPRFTGSPLVGSLCTLHRCSIDEELQGLQQRSKLLKLRLGVQVGEAQFLAACTANKAPSSSTMAYTWRQEAKENTGEGLLLSLAVTMPHEAHHGPSSSFGQGWAQTPYRTRGLPPCEDSVDEASSAWAAHFQGEVTNRATQSEQWSHECWEAYNSRGNNWNKQVQHVHELQAAKQEDQQWFSTPASGEVEGDWQANHQGESDITDTCFNGEWWMKAEGATMPVVDQGTSTMKLGPVAAWVHRFPRQSHCHDSRQNTQPVHLVGQGSAYQASQALLGIDLYGKFKNAAHLIIEPKQVHLRLKAAAASWHPTNCHSGWHASHGTLTSVMQNVQAVASTAENIAVRDATARKLDAEEAATLQHVKSEYGAFRIKVGHFCGYCGGRGVGSGVLEEEYLGCVWGFSLGDHDCGRGHSLGSPSICDSCFPQMAENLKNEAREVVTRAAAEHEAATHAWGKEHTAALRRFISEHEVGPLLAWT